MADEPRHAEADATELRALALDRRGRERVRAVLNVLTESTFFYKEDDPDLFFFLRRNQAAFREIFESYFGWRLHVDRQCARLLKAHQYNEALRPSQRALFDLRRRDECLLFALLLEFHEEEGQRQGVTPDEDRHLRFLLADFVTFAFRRFREELGEATPPDGRIFEATRPLFEQLERHRFVRLVDKKQAEAGDELPAGMAEHLLYEFLPGIRCYDPSLAARGIVLRAYRSTPGDEPDGGSAEGASGPHGETTET
ncbi:MAG: DUF2398 family protein [Deltaproteobacteria bacterium]|nr:DUF2398 family protein [Deltaproteobacteria bacterium]